MDPKQGHFYIVGVGPGASDLLTLRAINIIKKCDVIIAPRSKNSNQSMALNIIKDYINTQKILEVRYTMKRDLQATCKVWEKVSNWTIARLAKNQSIVQITLGDPLLYSTSNYLFDAIKNKVSLNNIHIIPGISAGQAAAAAFKHMIASQEDRVAILPASDLIAIEQALENNETVIIYKIAKQLDKIIHLLKKKNLIKNAKLAISAEQKNQILIENLNNLQDTNLGYMSIILVRISHRNWSIVNE